MSMGCAKNSVDSERLAGRIISAGHEIVSDVDKAEIGIINTCGFIQDAVKENIDAILDLEQLKLENKLKHIIVTGCLVNRYEQELKAELPTVDLFTRAESWDDIIKLLTPKALNKLCDRFMLEPVTPWSRYLKLSEGCNKFCTYCSIPFIRGRLRSVEIKDLVNEALKLCEGGAKEICLVAQDLMDYGKDLYNKPMLKELIEILNKELPDGTWLRPLYMYPDEMTHEFIDFMLSQDKVLRYFDMPVQHISDKILRRMNRKTTSDKIKDIIKYVRSCDKFFTLRTTIMTGFPGETESDFDELLEFLSEAKIDHAGAFIFSPEEGTRAAEFADQVDFDTAQERYQAVTDLQFDIAQERGELFIDKELEVLIEEINIDAESAGQASQSLELESLSSLKNFAAGSGADNLRGDNLKLESLRRAKNFAGENGGGEFEIWGRSYRDAPDVDGRICVEGLLSDRIKLLKPGYKVKIKIQECVGNDLFGKLV
ncbi:MAG: 30S ribosomal protein S12 methylthiotransferase RimO [Synergistaceae bacterium]|nr:30S ribosomal protein S12 methylthiotransferase RimO [Synergistaceae bacterium]